MPLYMCNHVPGVLTQDARQKIAADITDIHCAVTGAPRTFVHVFFFEDAPQLPLNGKSVFLFGSIRAGRDAEQKQALITGMKDAISRHAGIAVDGVFMDTIDVPAHWVMEGGDILPEPGAEDTWLQDHAAAGH